MAAWLEGQMMTEWWREQACAPTKSTPSSTAINSNNRIMQSHTLTNTSLAPSALATARGRSTRPHEECSCTSQVHDSLLTTDTKGRSYANGGGEWVRSHWRRREGVEQMKRGGGAWSCVPWRKYFQYTTWSEYWETCLFNFGFFFVVVCIG